MIQLTKAALLHIRGLEAKEAKEKLGRTETEEQ